MNGIYTKKGLMITSYLEKEILNGNYDYVCRIYPLFRSKMSIFHLWKLLFALHCHDENKVNMLVEFIKVITRRKYISLMDEMIEELTEILNDIKQCDGISNEIINIATDNENIQTANYNLFNIQTNKKHFIDGIFIIEPKILAYELTYICSRFFSNINVVDFLKIAINYNYNDNNDIVNLIKLSDTLSFIISYEIIVSDDIQYQEFLILYFIKAAFILKKINNFHMLFSICAGLNHPKVQNIKHLWIGKKYISKLNELVDIIKFDKNYKNYRTLLNKRTNTTKNMGIIPYIGVLLLDLSNICEIEIIDDINNSINENILHDINNYLATIDILNNNYNYSSNPYAFNRIARLVNETNIVDLYDITNDDKKKRRLSEPNDSSEHIKNKKNNLLGYSKRFKSVQYFTR